MKIYSSDKTFPVMDFPLCVTLVKQRSSMPRHRHDYIELTLVASGHTIHQIWNAEGDKLSYGLIQGDLFSVMPGEIHAYSENNRLVLYNIAFKPEIIQKDLDELSALRIYDILFTPGSEHFRNRIHLSPMVRKEAELCLKKIIAGMTRREGWRLRMRIALLEFLTIVNDSMISNLQEISKATRLGLLKVLDLLENSPEKNILLDEMAKTAGMSVSLFTRKFRDLTGDSPIAYRLGLRLEMARKMLTETKNQIADIAFRCGFCDSNYMIKRFKERNGVTPGQYRKMILPRR